MIYFERFLGFDSNLYMRLHFYVDINILLAVYRIEYIELSSAIEGNFLENYLLKNS